MRPPPTDPDDTELAPDFTVRQYKAARDVGQQGAIADAIQKRFTERYITPVTTGQQHGFTIMAIACLTIEALESFRRGWKTSDGRGGAAFCFFFDREDLFQDLRGHAQQFYTNVRCGILHQAETTGGWKIARGDAPLIDQTSNTINAREFISRLQQVLDTYCASLRTAPWTGPDWKNVRKKMNSICDNCRI